jgi:hypothetical protein
MSAIPDLKLLATAHKLLYDTISVLTNEENANAPFEIGCRCKTPEFQDQLYDVMSAVFRNTEIIKVNRKPEDYILCIKREEADKEVAQKTEEAVVSSLEA